ncbi:MAG: hypothetical protein IJW40_04110 [Clostridia bacterium]|nr:hypothetical protein [Clostridia bacterium]
MKHYIHLFFIILLLLYLVSCGEETVDPFEDITLTVQQELTLATNAPPPAAGAFLPDALREMLKEREITVSYAEPLSVTALGQQTAYLCLRAPNGDTRMLSVPYQGIYDTIPPTVTGLRDRSALCGEGVMLRDGIQVIDNCLGEVTLTVDGSSVDNTRQGVYEVIYTAVDAAGNTATFTSPVYIYEVAVTEAQLMEKIDPLLDRIITEGMSKEEICRGIYATVQASLYYVADADKSDWMRAAYTSLFVTGSGDCFSYFAAAKALLHRAGIEYIEIQRSEGYTQDTHYWLLVNIAEPGQAARWYYFDPTELRNDDYNHSGCLLTAEQVGAYNRVRPHFYQHDTSSLPPICEQVITPTPELGY